MRQILKNKFILSLLGFMTIGLVVLVLNTFVFTPKYKETVPGYHITNYRFVGDKGVAVNWTKDEDSDDGGFITAESSRFITNLSYKLFSTANGYRGPKKSGEEWVLKVYDLKEDTIEEKNYDIFEVVDRYAKGATPYSVFMRQYLYQGRYYIGITLKTKSGEKVVTVLDLETGSIPDFSWNDKESRVYLVNDSTLKNEHDTIAGITFNTMREKLLEFGLSYGAYNVSFENKSLVHNSHLQLETVDPVAYRILTQPDAYFYFTKMRSSGNSAEEFRDSLQLFLPEGVNAFDNPTFQPTIR